MPLPGTPGDPTEQRQESRTPLLDRRGGEEQPAPRREPRWLTWTRANQDRGKDLTERRPA